MCVAGFVPLERKLVFAVVCDHSVSPPDKLSFLETLGDQKYNYVSTNLHKMLIISLTLYRNLWFSAFSTIISIYLHIFKSSFVL